MTGYNSQVGGGKYCIQYETDSRENYREVEELIRGQIDGKPSTFDVEAVVAQLDDYAMWKEFMIYDLSYRERKIIDKAIEIVRGGRNDCNI